MMKDVLPITIYIAAAVFICLIPYVKVYFSIWNTLIVEVVIFFTTGKNKPKKQINEMTEEKEKNGLKYALKLYIGYTGMLAVTIGLFYLLSKHNYQEILYILIGMLGFSLIIWIRKLFKLIWAITFIILLGTTLYLNIEIAITHLAIFLSFVILVQSILSSFFAFRNSVNVHLQPNKRMMTRLKEIPIMIFGFVLLVQSIYIGFFIIKSYFLS